MWERARNIDSGWVGADDDDHLDETLAAEAMSEPFDLARPHVMTALGPVEPAALGPVLMGEHLATFTDNGSDVDREVLLAELEDAYAVGIRSIVVLPGGAAAARDATHWLAGRSPVHLILLETHSDEDGGQAHSDPVGGLSLAARSSAAIFDALIQIGSERDLSIHLSEIDADLLPTVRRLLDQGVKPGRIWSDGDLTSNSELAFRLLAEGFSLAVRTGSGESPTEARRVAEMVNAGHLTQVVLASGVKRIHALPSTGVTAWGDVIDRFAVDLLEAGLSGIQVRQLLVENPARLLTIHGD